MFYRNVCGVCVGALLLVTLAILVKLHVLRGRHFRTSIAALVQKLQKPLICNSQVYSKVRESCKILVFVCVQFSAEAVEER